MGGREDAQEGIGKGDLLDVLHEGVVEEVAVDEEEDGEVDLLVPLDALLLEAEALDLGKVRRDLRVPVPEKCQRFLPSTLPLAPISE